MKHTLKDGRAVEIAPLSEKIPTKWLLEYINGIIEEDGYVQSTEKFSIEQEEEWKGKTIEGMGKGKQMYLIAICGKKVVGGCGARREEGRGRGNVVVSIAVSREFRGARLGEFIMRKMIGEIKEKFMPDNIYLYVASANKTAIKLYEKLGFVEFVRYPDWWVCKGKRVDSVGMILER